MKNSMRKKYFFVRIHSSDCRHVQSHLFAVAGNVVAAAVDEVDENLSQQLLLTFVGVVHCWQGCQIIFKNTRKSLSLTNNYSYHFNSKIQIIFCSNQK